MTCDEKNRPNGPARVLLRRLLGEQRHDSRLEARQAALQEPQRHELPDRLRERHADHDEAEPARRAQDHRLAPVSVRQAPPYRRENREADEVAAVDNTRPARDLSRPCYAELLNVERQDRRHLTHPHRYDE